MFRAIRVTAVALHALLVATASTAGACSVSATSMAFGPYEPLTFAGKLASADRTADATVSVVCTAISSGGSYTITLGPSSQGNSIIPRYLTHDAGGPGMAFNVYLDGAYSMVWGDGFTGAVISGTIPGGDSTSSHTVFGKVPAGQGSLQAGSYSGSLTMTVTYNP
ncbi:spore coat protein U domain-containing protein [Ramlibacter ginsenosidimutans]|uniref:Spore coat protein U domain-containing protein n=1 Tax=Ramlibacter ginsenosidimutans TaxID=502333 RepID=A0A934TSR3_9BURK|nr:spore coat U domain-containing protein [Ramlibacter ginsenosidimutans]MBK6006615.1 spore coat protein U domain-containing protein [Ramlibacter ginsenosidimutans]